MPTNGLPLKLAYTFGVSNGFAKEINDIKALNFERNSPYNSPTKRRYLRCGSIIELFERHQIYEILRQNIGRTEIHRQVKRPANAT
jgi:hypothetical protein